MKYAPNELDRLWGLIKDKPNIFVGEYIGLIETKFELSIDEFRKRNRDEHKKVIKDMETIVLTDIKKAIQTLFSVDIRCHHLSCAADTGIGNNSALCVHYRYPKDDKFYALIIPGINYVPTEETMSELKKIYKGNS